MKEVPHKKKNVAQSPPYGKIVAKRPPHTAKKNVFVFPGGG